MKKTLQKLILGATCLAMLLPLAACDDGNKTKDYTYDPESRPVALALGAVEEKFNPFFYTSQNDGEVISLTQISLITADEEAQLTCGQNEATVAHAYRETTTSAGDTVYEYVIKNGIKFSDGVDLTIKDVLFNLYVYLDPQYSGSSTIYSTKIKGLMAYRSQQPNMSDNASDDAWQKQFVGEVNKRINNLIQFDTPNSGVVATPEIEADVKTTAAEFKKELASDWVSFEGTVKSYQDEYLFTEDWEPFLLSEGIINYQYEFIEETNSSRRKTTEGYDSNGKPLGKFLTTMDEGSDEQAPDKGLRTYMANALEGLEGDARAEKMRETAIDLVYDDFFEEINGSVSVASTGKLRTVIQQRATGSNLRTTFLNEAMSDYFADKTQDGGLAVDSIEGITTYKTTKSDFGRIDKGSELNENETYDVLKIEIKGEDPAAKWQFGFTVAPMHIYSGSIDGVDYVKRANETAPDNDKVSNRFGVPFMNKNFFDTVLNAPEKTRYPVGAGVYKVKEGNDRIYLSNVAAYERNTYFETVGSELSNAKIKYLNYQKTNDDMLVDTLKSKGLDYGTPQCTPDNIKQLDGSGLNQIRYDANGFGYIGINPKYVPNILVRRAIMKAMNVSSIVSNYYTADYAEVIRRPISTTSWVYTMSSDQEKAIYFSEYPNIKYSSGNTDEIIQLVTDAGYTQYTTINGRQVRTNEDGDTLRYTFTIAGETEDHPAFDMFTEAARRLNEIGFDITVQTNIQALSLLAQGRLAIWAAAWTSGIDPDMYQVYHKDSKATSVKNWGYDVIIPSSETEYIEEKKIINDLAKLIEDGRRTNNQSSRVSIYREALNKVMELAVELPTYQRKDLCVFNSQVIDGNSLNRDANANAGVLNRIWELDYN